LIIGGERLATVGAKLDVIDPGEGKGVRRREMNPKRSQRPWCRTGVRIILFAVIGALAAFSASIRAQGWPARPVRVIVPVSAGGAADVLVRLVMNKLSPRLGEPIITENRPGASGLIGMELTAKSPPDGYTVTVIGNDATWVNQIVKTDFDVRRDLAPITILRRAYFVAWVSSAVPARTPGEFVAYAQSNPGKVNYGSNGSGSGSHLGTESLKLVVPGLDLVHVPFKGEAQTAAALAAGDIQFALGTYTSYAAQAAAGKVRAIGVTGERRLPALPQTATFVESGIPYVNSYWSGFMAPQGTPREITTRLASELKAVYQFPDVHSTLTANGEEVGSQSPEEFAKVIADEVEFRTRAVKAAGLKPE
jgi:tripartite-type tricarboxylate transporter receptor subunit TctC